MMARYNIQSLIKIGEQALIKANEPITGAKYLMMDLFDLSHTDIYLSTRMLDEQEKAQYLAAIDRLAAHVPLAHITGYQIFYERKFLVSKDVLIPRPETEELVELVLSKVHHNSNIVDVGTGSGAIAITLSKERSQHIYATDISYNALQMAARNAEILEADVTFFQGDCLQPLIDARLKVDCLVSNPPYIAADEMHLMNETALHDPHIALFAEDDGLFIYKKIINTMHHILNDHALIAFEIGHLQGDVITTYIKQLYPHLKPNIVKDINGLDRIVWFEWCE